MVHQGDELCMCTTAEAPFGVCMDRVTRTYVSLMQLVAAQTDTPDRNTQKARGCPLPHLIKGPLGMPLSSHGSGSILYTEIVSINYVWLAFK